MHAFGISAHAASLSDDIQWEESDRRYLLRRRAGQKLALHVGETTISFPFTPQQARNVSASITSLLETFAAKQKAERPRRWDMMEYRYKGMLCACSLADLGSLSQQLICCCCHSNA